MSELSDKQRIEKACEDEAFQAALQRYAHANGSSMAIMQAAALALANCGEMAALASLKAENERLKDIACMTHTILSGCGDWRVETPNEGVLVKLFELQGMPITPAVCLRDVDRDHAVWLEERKA